VFLGVHEKLADGHVSAALPGDEFSSPDSAVAAIKKLDGTPYFAMDVADLVTDGQFSEETLLDVFKQSNQGKEGKIFLWSEPRVVHTVLDHFTAGIFASARSLADWNYRNNFCPGCGSGTYSMWGGWKISCRSLLPWADNTGKRSCPSG
jgi:NAD+ diphosphatase